MAEDRDLEFRPPSESAIEWDALRRIVEGTATSSGAAFFPALVESLAKVMNVGYAFVAEFAGENRARTLAYWQPGGIAASVEWALPGTPCEEVVKGQLCHHESEVYRKFPDDQPLVDLGIESYLGVPLSAPDGHHLGHLAVFDPKPLPLDPRTLAVFRIFAARAAAELTRLRLERRLAESEDRFRDLFDEAPIAYVHEGLDFRFIRANRTAMRTLGITAEEVEGTFGSSFIPDTPEAQARLKAAAESIGRGTDTSGIVLELRRRDNGKPLWIQWWSRPDPSGTYTRTMFIDITERILLEQEQDRLKAQNLYLREEIKSVHNFEEIVGRSPGLVHVLEDVARVAPTEASVLITGETGTGKELIARAIHSRSRRHDKPLIKLNCAALPTSLVESELFGHEKGAFTGAISRRIGRFELANGGTIFLDEIGEVPLDVQVKLLRVIQEHEFERVGGNTPIRCDVRIVAATNRDLRKAMAEGSFREDLYYRLNVFPVSLPPLRERGDDIPLLVQYFLARFCARIGKRIRGISAETMARFRSYPWPGNVRELENFVERAVILANSEVLDASPDPIVSPPPPSPAVAKLDRSAATGASFEAVSRDHIVSVLEKAHWVIEGEAGAAKILELHPNTLRSRMKKLGISRPKPL